MASHRNADDAPADDQAFSETFDEDKADTAADQQRPDREKADQDAPARSVDDAIDGDTGERFGELVNDEEPLRRREAAADQARSDAIPVKPKEEVRSGDAAHTPAEDADTTLDPDEKIDEAMEETFPASDPPPIRPGEA